LRICSIHEATYISPEILSFTTLFIDGSEVGDIKKDARHLALAFTGVAGAAKSPSEEGN
jgi:hypothetical protein